MDQTEGVLIFLEPTSLYKDLLWQISQCSCTEICGNFNFQEPYLTELDIASIFCRKISYYDFGSTGYL